MKKFFKKIWGGIKKPFSFIKRKTAPTRAFMKSGRPGGMILELALGVFFYGWAVRSMLYEKIPMWASYLIVAAAFLLIAELGSLLLKLIIGGSKRCKDCTFLRDRNECYGNSGYCHGACGFDELCFGSLRGYPGKDYLGIC